jgi:hypothetical protein
MADNFLAIWKTHGIGARLSDAANAYLDEYVYSAHDHASDHEPTEFERDMMEDMLAGMFSDDRVHAILQEAARGMKAGGMDPEGPDDPVVSPDDPAVTRAWEKFKSATA